MSPKGIGRETEFPDRLCSQTEFGNKGEGTEFGNNKKTEFGNKGNISDFGVPTSDLDEMQTFNGIPTACGKLAQVGALIQLQPTLQQLRCHKSCGQAVSPCVRRVPQN